MEVMTILILLVLSIALPTLDTVTDINLVIKLYRGAYYCQWDIYTNNANYEKCKKNPASYCSDDENNQYIQPIFFF